MPIAIVKFLQNCLMKKQFDWTSYIKSIESFPSFKRIRELDYRAIIGLYIKKLDSVLEVGCSNARWPKWLAKTFGGAAFGLDNNPVCKKYIRNFKLGDVRNLPYKNNSFSCTFSLGLIEHFKHNEAFKIISEKKRVTKKNGIIITIIPNLDYSIKLLTTKLIIDPFQGYKHFIYKKKDLEEIYKKNYIPILFSGYCGLIFDNYLPFLKRIYSKIPRNKILSDSIIIIGKKL